MPTVALIGPDGAGKTTLSQRLQRELGIPVKYIYMGVNLEASNVVLPTTRLMLAFKRARGKGLAMGGPPDPAKGKVLPKHPLKRVLVEAKSALRMVNQLGEEWYRQAVIRAYERQGNLVLFDRHFLFDYYFHDIKSSHTQRTLSSRAHGFLLNRFYPRPDLVLCLDAPAEVLFVRKPEGTIEALEQRRQEYLQLRHLAKNFVLVDATQPLEQVYRQAAAEIEALCQIPVLA